MNVREWMLGWAMAIHLPMAAQNPPTPRPVVWVDSGKILVFDRENKDHPLTFETLKAGKIETVDIPPASSQPMIAADFFDGSVWAIHRERLPQTEKTSSGWQSTLYRRSENLAWEKVGEFRTESFHLIRILPLGSGRFFGISGSPGSGFGDGREEKKPFALLRLGKEGGRFDVERTIDAGLEKPFFQKAKSGQGWELHYPALSQAFMNPPVLRYEGGFSIVDGRTGYIWMFDANDGKLKRVFKLFSGVDEKKLVDPRDLSHALLGAQPRPNGHILLASRLEDAVLHAAQHTRRNLGSNLSDDEFKSIQPALEHFMNANVQLYPQVLWWDVDPSTGEVRPETPPQHFPEMLFSQAQMWAFDWRYKPDGNLLMVSFRGRDGKEPPEGSKKKGR